MVLGAIGARISDAYKGMSGFVKVHYEGMKNGIPGTVLSKIRDKYPTQLKFSENKDIYLAVGYASATAVALNVLFGKKDNN